MKRLIFVVLSLLLLTGAPTQIEARSKKHQQVIQQDPVEQTVYITRTGHKFHRPTCRYLRYSAYAMSREEAEARGYTPCKVCRP